MDQIVVERVLNELAKQECERYSKYKEERTRVSEKVKAARHEYWADKYVKRVIPSTKHFYNQ